MSDEDDKKGSLIPAVVAGTLVGAGMAVALMNRKARKLAFSALEHFLGLKVVEPEKTDEKKKEEDDK
jgi:hypothetical protein